MIADRNMIADQWCETSWRAAPGSFVSLMTLYESNFVRLRWLVRDLRAITDRVVSKSPTDCDLYLTPMDLSRYTSVFRLTYEFNDRTAGDPAAGDPAACDPAAGDPAAGAPGAGNRAAGDRAVCVRDPDLEVCVYHDARLAEVRSFRGFQRHPQLSRLQCRLKRELDQRWTRNMMLNKWLEYCAEQGHHF
ncbi:MAG TPA: DUF1249 domain-containing protein [Steroidobacteraceae bacterium]|nr:DUF1249 domain-containing protein [Steroidobacteraceae bacterium]